MHYIVEQYAWISGCVFKALLTAAAYYYYVMVLYVMSYFVVYIFN